MISRRTFVIAGGSLTLAASLPRLRAKTRTRFDRDPFALGIASGSPTPTGVVLWTRIAPDPLAPLGGVTQATLAVRWEVANDEAMRDIVQRGSVSASVDAGFSVHVEVNGLEPGRGYFYRFLAGDATSPVGRTRTAPPLDAAVERLRFAVACCQHYEHGYFGAYNHIVADDPDLVVFLGDYIYGGKTRGDDAVRHHAGPPPKTLADYRARYALYRTDPDLQAAHACCPWILTWDDHEVSNNYAGDWSPRGESGEQFLRRRTAAYQAFYEHMPLPHVSAPSGAALRLHARYPFGNLLSFHVLDGRQYRSPPACPESGDRLGPACSERLNPERSYFGQAQERWLEQGLRMSRTRWNIIAQQTLFSPFDRKPGPETRFSADGWDGYPAARDRLLEALATHRPSNPVFIGGDLHAFFVADVRRNYAKPSALLASEFVTSSISTRRRGSQRRLDKLRRENPHLLYADGTARGYIRIEVTANELRADLRAMSSVATRDAACDTAASYRVADGVPGPQAVQARKQ